MTHALAQIKKSANNAEVFEASFTISQAQKILGISRPTVMKLIEKKELRAVRVGKQWRIEPRDLRAFLDSNDEE